MRFTKGYSANRFRVYVRDGDEEVDVIHVIEADDRSGRLICHGLSNWRLNPDGSPAQAIDRAGRPMIVCYDGDVEIRYIHDVPLHMQ